MAKKKFTSTVILKEACQLAVEEGVSKVTVRGLSARIGMSTQPIYQEFENIEDLREVVSEQVFASVQQRYFNECPSLDAYIENLGTFLFEETKTYHSLMNDSFTHELMQKFLQRNFSQSVKSLKLSDIQKQLIYSHISGGLTANLIFEERLDSAEMIQAVKNQINQIYFSSK
ncbi:hypothetical protein BAU15_07510 [Enterococcus sp. JM4C]|uniref:TetR/AcrR family transcriptional regulator n=1 Tax=Candidatus Enterococcus huntleyi TaxID=1857217 RepID=UPI00137ADF5A|nr:TetR/AcrR family transcriptional regulator [Enterococcus sp. JM4C]KAF1297550.1 hypothetical protein BAU15_07510 [Enterococcus sp. JM4C]